MKKKILYTLAQAKMLKNLSLKASEMGSRLIDLENSLDEGVLGKDLLTKLNSIKEDAIWMLNHSEAISKIIDRKTGEKMILEVETISDENIIEIIEEIEAVKLILPLVVDNDDLLEKIIELFMKEISKLYDKISRELIELKCECFEFVKKNEKYQ